MELPAILLWRQYGVGKSKATILLLLLSLSLSLYFKQQFFVVVAVHEVLAIESATNSATVYNTKAPFPKAVSNKGFAR